MAIVILPGCGKRETSAERRQREAIDLCYKAIDCLKENDNARAESLLKQALEVDPLCEKAKDMLESMKGAYEDLAKAHISHFEAQLDMFRLYVGSYPTTNQGLQALRTPPADLVNPNKWRGPYSQKEIPADPWNHPYEYELIGREQCRIWSRGADGVDGTEDDIQNTQ